MEEGKRSIDEANQRRSDMRMSQTRITINDSGLDTIDPDQIISPDYGFGNISSKVTNTLQPQALQDYGKNDMDKEWNVPARNNARRSVTPIDIPTKDGFTPTNVHSTDSVLEEVK